MKRFSFGTFLVDDTNREAFDLCNDVAALRPVPALPMLLLAPPEGGKTHLLYAIANRIKATQPGTTLGFVRADAFPAQVRNLVHDPTPVERAIRAVFLVDDVEDFSEHAEALEEVVRLFLENGHAVVMASKLPPDQLANLTPGLREILAGGAQVRMGSYRHAPAAHANAPGSGAADEWTGIAIEFVDAAPGARPRSGEGTRHGSDDKIRALRRIHELETELEHVRADLALRHATDDDVERLRNAVDELKRRNQNAESIVAALRREAATTPPVPDTATLEAALRESSESAARMQEQLQSLERELTQVRDELNRKSALEVELEYAKRELAVLEQVQHEHGILRQQWESLKSEHARVQAQMRDAAEARDRALAVLHEHETALAERNEEVSAERARKEELLARMRGLLENIEQRRQRARAEDDSQDQLAHEVEHLAAERMPLVVNAAPRDVPESTLEHLLQEARDEATREWTARWQILEEESHVTQEHANEAAAECMRLQAAMEQQQAQIRDLQQTVASLTAEKKKLGMQLEATRSSGQSLQSERERMDEERRLLQEELNQVELEHQDLLTMLDEQRIELEMTRIALQAKDSERESQQNSHSQLTAERDSARAALESIRSEHERLRAQHKVAQRRLETALAELDALRHEAATQVAAANAQAGELEKRLAGAQEQFRYSRTAGQHVAKDLRDLEQRFLETAELVSRMSERLTSAVEQDTAAAESAYHYALTRPEASENVQLPLDMGHRDRAENDADDGLRSQNNPYDDEKFIPFKPAEHKINRTV